MINRLCLALAGLFAMASAATGAGTIPGFSLTPQFDLTGKIAPGCRLYVIQAGTTSTPQNSYQDSGLTLLQPNPLLCDAGGRIGQFFVADGTIKLRLTDRNGVQLFVGDNLVVVGASGGGGGGGTVDPTTIMQTGHVELFYGTGILSGFVRANGRTIGSATSGATERANADCQTLFQYLWGADANIVVSGGRGASAAADWAANKTITLPDARGRTVAGLDDMGNSAASRLTSSYFGATATILGAIGGGESTTLTLGQLPTGITSSNASQNISVVVNSPSNRPVAALVSASETLTFASSGSGSNISPAGNLNGQWGGITTMSGTTSNSISVTSNNTSGQAHRTVQPTILATIYIKL